ncbi:M14 family zinc carboxypeptidase, partial [Nocardioides sp.]|uniref:M14 family zinc carboxypeptidase n=1 Tax=Nocardioides sp. TaxID=35761 RepID=UPI002D7F9E74
MHRRVLACLVVLVVLGGLGAPATSQAEPGRAAERSGRGLEVYVGQVDPSDLGKLALAGLDHEDVATGQAPDGKVAVEVVMNGRQAAALAKDGVELSVKRINGKPASLVAAAQNDAGYEGFRSWSEPGGIADELRDTAAANPGLAKLVPFGTTVQGQEMLAVKVTNNANQVADGSRPAVMYLGAQHAREWITPEMVRRLMHHYIDNYGSDDQITRLLDTTELWFVPVANPDG